MALDDQLRARIEAVLRGLPPRTGLAEAERERLIAFYRDRLVHRAKIVLSEVRLVPPPGLRKAGVRGASTLAHHLLMDELCDAYRALTGRPPTRSEKHGGYGVFARDVHAAARLKMALDHAIQRACEANQSR